MARVYSNNLLDLRPTFFLRPFFSFFVSCLRASAGLLVLITRVPEAAHTSD